MNADEMKKRTQAFALRVVRLVQALPDHGVATVMGKQLMRAGTSVGANYRAACRAKSTADFIHKLTIVEEEADEKLYWMELLIEAGIVASDKLEPLMSEASQLAAMIVASIRTARGKRQAKMPGPQSEIRNPKSSN